MPSILVDQQTNDDHGWVFRVCVDAKSNGTATEHTVTVPRDYWKKLTGGDESPKALVERSFRFLLEREPKESILPTFELPVIQTYFSEYEKDIMVE